MNRLVIGVLWFSAFCAVGSANSLLYTGTTATLADSALFSLDRETVAVKLASLGIFDQAAPSDSSSDLFFSMSSSSTLAEVSEVLNTGSTIAYGSGPAYGSTPANGLLAGKFPFGGGTFPYPDLDGPAAPYEMNFGWTPEGGYTATGDPGGKMPPLPPDSGVFTFSSDLGGDRTLSTLDFWDVTVRTGTPLVESSALIAVPEPATMILIGGGLLALAAGAKRRLSKR